MWKKQQHFCRLSANVSTLTERKVVEKLGDDGKITCSVEEVSLVEINKEQLDPDIVNPTSIVESGDFISPSTMDYISPSDPAVVDTYGLADELDKVIEESSKTE